MVRQAITQRTLTVGQGLITGVQTGATTSSHMSATARANRPRPLFRPFTALALIIGSPGHAFMPLHLRSLYFPTGSS